MAWKYFGVLVVTIAFSTSLFAQKNDPFLGIWKLKSDDQTMMVVATPAPGGFTDMRITIGKDNKASAEIHPVAFDGKPYQTTGGDARKISYKRIDANTIERTQDRDGKISVDTEVVSKDGKTMTIKNPAGDRIYEKQFDVRELAR